MIKKHNFSESGQAMVFIVLAFIGLLGFVALAIDGGRLFTHHRQAQNAADDSALAGALVIASYSASDPYNIPQQVKSNAINAALARASTNGFINAPPDTEVIPTVTGPFNDSGLYYLVTLNINTNIGATFAQFVYPEPLSNRVTAVVKVRMSQNAVGNAIFSTDEHACKALWFSGTQNTTIIGGGAYSNSDANTQNCMAGVASGNTSVTVQNDGIFSVGGFEVGQNTNLNPPAVTGMPQIIVPQLPNPNCSGLTNYGERLINSKEVVILQPGIYSAIKVHANADITLIPGMYCINGSEGFTANGGTISGDGVFIYMQNGSFDLGGNTVINLNAATDLIDPSGHQWGGMLLYANPNNTQTMVINGGSNTVYTGTFWATGAETIINGNAENVGLYSQVVSRTILLTGTAEIVLVYNPEQNYHVPPALDLLE
jgi:Flp pilus assembly protein TadG